MFLTSQATGLFFSSPTDAQTELICTRARYAFALLHPIYTSPPLPILAGLRLLAPTTPLALICPRNSMRTRGNGFEERQIRLDNHYGIFSRLAHALKACGFRVPRWSPPVKCRDSSTCYTRSYSCGGKIAHDLLRLSRAATSGNNFHRSNRNLDSRGPETKSSEESFNYRDYFLPPSKLDEQLNGNYKDSATVRRNRS
ncbi:hypothetical protein B0H19DRAFT_1241877 [Mycena capillaripes]|nr:hypothetical protein B0H19DRAFT_1241877 [Mycena capillaripes]